MYLNKIRPILTFITKLEICSIEDAMEELCQNLLISGPDLALRRKANDSTKIENEDDSNNFDVNPNFILCPYVFY